MPRDARGRWTPGPIRLRLEAIAVERCRRVGEDDAGRTIPIGTGQFSTTIKFGDVIELLEELLDEGKLSEQQAGALWSRTNNLNERLKKLEEQNEASERRERRTWVAAALATIAPGCSTKAANKALKQAGLSVQVNYGDRIDEAQFRVMLAAEQAGLLDSSRPGAA
jgi:hypothetical protein